MKTQMFKAKDVKSAINLVNEEFGDKAIILSTKKNNGVVEVEASDNDEIIENHKRKISQKKTFSNVFLKQMNGEETKRDKNISYIKNPSKNYEQEDHKQKRMFEGGVRRTIQSIELFCFYIPQKWLFSITSKI